MTDLDLASFLEDREREAEDRFETVSDPPRADVLSSWHFEAFPEVAALAPALAWDATATQHEKQHPLLFMASWFCPCITQTPTPVSAQAAIAVLSHNANIEVLHAGISLPALESYL
eukprot:CAMPEP_0180180396 /NCGR_PEP_ID=MMETSP0986-20121125/39562_1 /TAXON_ID=697907 /ORGANISM="non described non described, Strain CCMP2293" /LENGTH=115 /DNA_ID=CAMNT_0022133599 /DNA_START=409 /DNA_END=758 /DNA_ORIENTATION=+